MVLSVEEGKRVGRGVVVEQLPVWQRYVVLLNRAVLVRQVVGVRAYEQE